MPERPLFFEHEGHRAVTDGRWKLTALNGQAWEQYDIEADRTDLDVLSDEHPDIVARLDRSWTDWAEANYVTPLPKDHGAASLKPAE